MSAPEDTPRQNAWPVEDGSAWVDALAQHDGVGLLFLDHTLRVRRVGLQWSSGFEVPLGTYLPDLVPASDAGEFAASLANVVETGQPLISCLQSVLLPQGGEPMLCSFSALPSTAAEMGAVGELVVTYRDDTELYHVRRHLDVLTRAAEIVGASLNVTEAAQRLTEAFVPTMADMAVANLAREVFTGDEPPKWGNQDRDIGLRRAAITAAGMEWSLPYAQPGQDLPPVPSKYKERFQQGDALEMTGRDNLLAAFGDKQTMAQVVPPEGHACLAVALVARGLVLGSITLWRGKEAAPFDDTDKQVIRDVATRGALSIDNARRYTREHTAAVTLQRQLLPSADRDAAAAQTVGIYVPTAGGPGVGGDWYDVVPLSSFRLAFVVGDVVGHGLHATATMSRMRAAVQTLADIDLSPDELLTRLDDMVLRLSDTDSGDPETLSGTCLYMIYDPVEGHCSVASAGHPPPVVLSPNGTTTFIDVTPGPPLGVGGMPFEVAELDVPTGSIIALYSDGLVERGGDVGTGMDQLAVLLPSLHNGSPGLAEAARNLVDEVLHGPPNDDVTLLAARIRTLDERNVGSWEIPAEPTAVANARRLTVEQLGSWRLDEVAFVTELVVSELVTNAIRYTGTGSVGLRLILNDDTLVCEVSDPSNSQPRLRRALSTDEGGRGLFLVAQLTQRWGCRYGREGKTIWAQQAVHAAAPPKFADQSTSR